MLTLGLSEEPPREESRLKQIFWPTIKFSEDVDTLASQGFWICMAVATLSLASTLLSGQPIIAVWICLIFFLGGAGIRQTSVAAAGSVFLVYLFEKVAAMIMMQGGVFGLLDYFILAILLANVRGTVKAAQWKHMPAAIGADLAPVRFNETWRDKFCDQMPPKLWPWGRYLFFALIVAYLGLSSLGVGIYLAHRHAVPSADVVVR